MLHCSRPGRRQALSFDATDRVALGSTVMNRNCEVSYFLFVSILHYVSFICLSEKYIIPILINKFHYLYSNQLFN